MEKLETLKKYFGYNSFRPGQEEIIDNILNGENVVTVLPTGAGKSLCFQLPALMSKKVSIVISPLIALMKDQVDKLNERSEVAAFINSSIDFFEIDLILQKINEEKIRLLYVAPERLENLNFAERIKRLSPSYLFVDEAHCISEWGHNFRPSYRKIKEFADYIGVRKISSFTATATTEVVKDIIRQLGLKNPKLIVKGFERENLFINVIPVKNKKEKVTELIRRYSTPAIIYTSSRKKAEEVFESLSIHRIKASYYHAGLSAIERKIVQENFLAGKFDVIVATNAFGMGIDKKDIRLVVHYNMPGTIENYYQEIGRAGRDGLDSYAFVLFDSPDVNIHQYFIANSYPDKELVLRIYDALCDYGNIAIGTKSEKEIAVNIDYISTASRRSITAAQLSASFKILEEAGYLKVVSGFNKKSYVQFLLTPERLKKIIKNMQNENRSEILLQLVREFGSAAFAGKVSINISALAQSINLSEYEVDEIITSFENSGILEYDKPLGKESIKLIRERIDTKHFSFNFKSINDNYLNAQKKLDQMIDFVFSKECRFKVVLRYFGEDTTGYKCSKCDNCLTPEHLSDSTIDYLQEIVLQTIKNEEDGIKENSLINVLIGKTKSEKFQKISFFGSCSNFTKYELIGIIKNLLSTGLIKLDPKKGKNLLLTNKGNELLIKRGLITEEVESVDYEKNLELLHKLKEVRMKAANKFNQPKYIICPDEVLREIVFSLPSEKYELLALKGFNERMFNKIGEEFLSIINEFRKKDKPELVFSDDDKKLPASINETQKLLLHGYSLKEIAELRKMNEAVISMQIETIIEVYPETDISRVINPSLYEAVIREYKKGIKGIKDLKKKFEPDATYPEIRIALAKAKVLPV